MTEVLFKDDTKPLKPLHKIYFHDLAVMECFVVDSPSSKGAVYMKVEDRSRTPWLYRQLELATGLVFQPTGSPIHRVDVKVEIDCKRPEIYKEDIPF